MSEFFTQSSMFFAAEREDTHAPVNIFFLFQLRWLSEFDRWFSNGGKNDRIPTSETAL